MMIHAGEINCCATTGAYLTQRKEDDGRSPVGQETKGGHNGGSVSVSVFILPIPHSHHRFTLNCIGTGCRKPLVYVRMWFVHTHDRASSAFSVLVAAFTTRHWFPKASDFIPSEAYNYYPTIASPNCCRSRNRSAPLQARWCRNQTKGQTGRGAGQHECTTRRGGYHSHQEKYTPINRPTPLHGAAHCCYGCCYW